MYNNEIENILYSNVKTAHIFQGVYPIDKLPKNINTYPQAYVFNTDVSTGHGEHWVSLYRESKNTMFEYFDSFGLYPLDLNIYKFIKNKYFLASSKILQNLFSSACGQYCIFFYN